jgi:tetratricopeptide (TPR) repeat protein
MPNTGPNFASARQLVLAGQYEAGLAALRALNFDDHPDVAAYVGLAHRKLDRLDEAKAWYERALAADPNHRLALSFYGMMLAETGDLAGARSRLARIGQLCGNTDCNEYRALQSVIGSATR